MTVQLPSKERDIADELLEAVTVLDEPFHREAVAGLLGRAVGLIQRLQRDLDEAQGELAIWKQCHSAPKPAHEREPPHCSTCSCGLPGQIEYRLSNGTAQPPAPEHADQPVIAESTARVRFNYHASMRATMRKAVTWARRYGGSGDISDLQEIHAHLQREPAPMPDSTPIADLRKLAEIARNEYGWMRDHEQADYREQWATLSAAIHWIDALRGNG